MKTFVAALACFVAVSVVSAASAAGSSAAPAGAAPLRIGLIAPLSGGSADFGKSVREGAELAISEVNAMSTYLGRTFELVVRDDKGDPASGKEAALNLVTHEKVAATIGFCNTGVAMNALDVFESNQHVLIVPCAQGTAITRKTPAAQSYVFRTAPSDAMNAGFLVTEIVDHRKLMKVAILADTTGYGNGGVADITAELQRRSLQPAYVGRFALGVTSLRSEVDAARAAGAQVLVVYAVGPEQAVAVKARSESKWNAPYFAPWTLSFRSVLDKAGAPALEGTMMTQSIIQDSANESRASFIARYYKHTGNHTIGSLMAAAQAYDAVHLMSRAVLRTPGDLSGPALKKALENLSEPYRGVVTIYDHPFSGNDHDAFSSNMIWLGVWRGGDVRYFYASDARLSAAVRRKTSR